MDESNKSINILQDIFSSLDMISNNDSDGLELFAGILATPDEQFKVIAPVLLDSFETTFNLPDAQIAFAQMMNTNGVKLEDMNENMTNFADAVDELSDEEFSQQKKDFIKSTIAIFLNSLNNAQGVSRRIIQIPIELCRDDAKLPTYATTGSAAMDIYAPEEFTLNPGETKIISVGLKVNIPRGYALLIHPRSGLSARTKMRVANNLGLIDSDYHDEIGVIVENISNHIVDSTEDPRQRVCAPVYGSPITIGKGERFAQMRLVEVPLVNWFQVDSLGEFQDDHGSGFGSTGST